MRQKIAAFLLSALVFPGLGQLYNQDRRKGVILVLAANGLLGLVLLTGLILFSREYTLVFFPRPLTADMVKMLPIDTLTHPRLLGALRTAAGLVGLCRGGRGPPGRAAGSGIAVLLRENISRQGAKAPNKIKMANSRPRLFSVGAQLAVPFVVRG